MRLWLGTAENTEQADGRLVCNELVKQERSIGCSRDALSYGS